MKIVSSFQNGCLRFYLSGELDHHAAKQAMTAIDEKISTELPRILVLDFEQLTFMDSSGIALVLKSYRRMEELGGRIRVEKVQLQPMRVLHASGVERIVDIASAMKEL